MKNALTLVFVAALAAGAGAFAAYTPPAIKCAEARHLVECGECQGITTRVVVETVEQARKRASTAPVGS